MDRREEFFGATGPFQPPLEALATQLALGGTNLVVAVAEDPVTRREVIAELGRALYQRVALAEFIFDADNVRLIDHLRGLLPPTTPTAIFGYGLSDLPDPARRDAIHALNWQRDTLARLGYAVVLWVAPNTVRELAFSAPDFWAWKTGLIEFPLPLSQLDDWRESNVARLGLRETNRLRQTRDLYEEHLAAPQPHAVAADLRLKLAQVYAQLEENPARQRALRDEAFALLAQRDDRQRLRQTYLDFVVSRHDTLKLRGIRTHQPVRVELENIYITLNTTASPRERFAHPERREAESKDTLEREARDTALHELMRESARLVILGAPGSGKSTFLAYLALTYARGRDQVKARLDLDEARIPVFIPLRDFALALNGATGIPALFTFLDQHLADAGLDFPKNYFEPDCAAGNCLFLFDGVDEVVDETKRALAAEVIEQLAQTFPQNRIVVTSRLGGYRGAAQLSAAFQIATVREFDGEQIEKFVENWCVAVETAQAAQDAPAIRRVAATAARDLIGAIQGNPRVRALAVNPLLLTVIALVHRYRATLPERRAELYDECTDVLLGYWDLGKTGVAAKMLAAYTGLAEKMDTGERRAFLEPVALAFQEAGKVELDEDEVLNALSAQFLQAGYDRDAQRARQDAQRFLEIVSLRSGLLQERAPRVYAFSHLTFQEYLAARLVAERDDFVAYLLARVDDSWWREVILLAAGHLSASGKARATRLLRALLDHNTPASNILAGQALIDIGRFRIDGRLQNDAIEKLLPTMQNARLDVKTRAAAGETLDALGWLPPDLDAFVPIRNQVSALRGNLVSWIAKYPVTYSQFQKFIDAGGYANEKFWRDQRGIDEKGNEKKLGNEAWDWLKRRGGAERRPREWDNPRFHRAGYPVIGVTWYEASAYCRWLTEQFQIADFRLQIGNSNVQLPTSNIQFRLPTEAEWVRAAGGDANNRAAWDKPGESTGKLPAEKRQEIVLARANVKESDLGGTTSVAMYPDGKRVTEDGDAIWDLQGNAWEWTSTMEGWRTFLRGGSWYNSAGEILVTSRDGSTRNNGSHNLSFRVVSPSPISPRS